MLILSTERLAENIIVEGENKLFFCSSHLLVLTNTAWSLSFAPPLSFLDTFGIFTGQTELSERFFFSCFFLVWFGLVLRGEGGGVWSLMKLQKK